MPSRILAVGELLWDLLQGGARLGGTTANFALGCARLGNPSALVTCVGNDELGRKALEEVRRTAAGSDFDESLIQVTDEAPTGTVNVALGADGHPQYTIVAPVAWDKIALTTEAMESARAAPAMCYGTLAQRLDRSRETIRALVEATGEECVRVFDVNVRLPFCSAEVVQWSLQHATLAKISEEELELVFQLLGIGDVALHGLNTSVELLESAGHAILRAAPRCKLVAITMGARGSILVSEAESDYHPGFRVAVADTVGAGDAFTCGLTHAYLKGAPLKAINQVGNLYGSYVASQPGAMPPIPESLLASIREAVSA